MFALSSSLAVGTLGLLHPSAAGASVPKPPPNTSSSQPGSILQPNGEPSVFWVGANNVLFNYWYVSGSWYSGTVAGQGSSYSNPYAVLQPNNAGPSVFVEGPGNTLSNYWYADGTWNFATIAGPNTTFSSPVAVLQPNGSPSVFVEGPNETLSNYWYASGVWNFATIGASSGTTYATPTAVLQTNGEPSVFVFGQNYQLYNYWYVSGSWNSAPVTPVNTEYSAPSAILQSDGASPSVFFAGPGSSLLNYWYIPSNGTWGSATVDNNSSFPVVGDPFAVQSNGAPSVFFESANNTMLNFFYIPSNGTWGSGTVATSSTPVCSDPSAVLQPNNAGPSVFVTGCNNALWNFWYASGIWNNAQITAAETGPLNPPPSSTFGGSNPSVPTLYSCTAADAVECATGNYTETYKELSVPGRGVGLSFSLTYNSLGASQNSPVGFGWTDPYNMSLSVNTAAGTAMVTQEDGSTVTFLSNGSSWVPPSFAPVTLTANSNGTYTFDRIRDRELFTFSSSGQLSTVADTNGYTTTLGYTGSQLSSVTDPEGRKLTITYGTNGLVSQVQDPASRSVELGYDTSGELSSITDPANRITSFTYDTAGQHLILTSTEPNAQPGGPDAGAQMVNTYNTLGQVTRQKDPAGLTTIFVYSGNTTTITDPHGNVRVEQFLDDEPVNVVDGYGTSNAATWQYVYDPITLVRTSVTDPNNHTTLYTDDAAGNILTATDPLHNETINTYNSLDEPLTETDPYGVKTTFSYDTNGNLQSKAVTGFGGSPVETTNYTVCETGCPSGYSAGDVESVTDPDGHVISYTYDSYGDLATTTTHPSSSSSDTTADVYDVVGRKVCEASPNATAASVSCPPAGQPRVADTSTWSYNNDKQVTSSTDAVGNTTNDTYDADGNATQVTDPMSKVTASGYDADNRKTSVTDGSGTGSAATTSYVYDLAPGIGACSSSVAGATYCTTTTDPKGNVTVDWFNSVDKKIAQTVPASGTTTYAYDLAGNLLSTTTLGGTATYGYDTDNRETSITYSSPASGYAAAPNVTYKYNADSSRSQMIDGTGTTNYGYDTLDRVNSVTNGANAQVIYGYDLDNNVASIEYPNGKSVTYGYDQAGEPTTVSDWLGNTISYSFDSSSNPTTQTDASANVVKSTFNNDNQVTGISEATVANPNSPIASMAYTYNADTQVATESDSGLPAPASQTYSYDPLSRVTGTSNGTYAYDVGSDPVTLANGATQTFATDDQLSIAYSPITLVGTASAGEKGKTTSLSVSLPSGTQANDQILVTATLPGNQTVSTPTGYTLMGPFSSGNTSSDTKVAIFRRTAQTGDSSVSVSFGSKFAKTLTVAVYRGVSTTTPIDAYSDGTTTSGTSVTASSVTTTSPTDQLVVLEGANSISSGSFTSPSGMTTRATISSGSTIVAAEADQALTSSGATGTRTSSYSTSGALVDVLVALSPARSSYGYNATGDRTTMTSSTGAVTNLGYDQADRLISFGTSTTYAFNGDGLRISKTTSGTVEAYTWNALTRVPELLVDGSTNFVYASNGAVLEQITSSGTIMYYLRDQLGSTRALTNSSGAIIASYTYNAYGQLAGSTGTVTNPLGFAGSYTDVESGYLYLDHRYYDPTSAVFLTVDPAVESTGQPYEYGFADPISTTDASGLSPICDGGGCFGSGPSLPPCGSTSGTTLPTWWALAAEGSATLQYGNPTITVQMVAVVSGSAHPILTLGTDGSVAVTAGGASLKVAPVGLAASALNQTQTQIGLFADTGEVGILSSFSMSGSNSFQVGPDTFTASFTISVRYQPLSGGGGLSVDTAISVLALLAASAVPESAPVDVLLPA